MNIPEMTLEQAVEHAYRTRPDYLAALERIKAAEAAKEAANGETLPSVRVNANYGALGLSVADSHSTYTVAGTVDIPIFQGGRARGRKLEAETELRRRRTDADDLKGAVYYEVRTAMLDLQTGNEQLEVAARGRMLAASELAQARDRFAAGVASNIEVVQAQTAITLADDQVSRPVHDQSRRPRRGGHRGNRREVFGASLMADERTDCYANRIASPWPSCWSPSRPSPRGSG